VSVKVDHQVVTLSGKAKTADDRRKMAEAAQSVNGVKTVINNLTVEP
jgi:osmotically-inducible protein OsmY